MKPITKFYRKRLFPKVYGSQPITEVWSSIHETKCFHFCVMSWEVSTIEYFQKMEPEETVINLAKKYCYVKRVDKRGSRFAFATEEEALKHLVYLKRKQIVHMERDLKTIKSFVERIDKGEQFVRTPPTLFGIELETVL